MNTRLSRLLVAALLVGAAVPAVSNEPAEKSFLWRVTGGERTVALLGSIHFMKDRAKPFSPVIEDAYAASELLVFETDIDEIGSAAIGLMAAAGLEDGRTLADVVGPDLYRRVGERFKALGMDGSGFDHMQPWMVALSLTSFELMRAGYLGSAGIDARFNARAAADGKDRLGLETPEFQVSLFADLSPQEGREFLDVTLAELDTVIPLVDDVVAAWESGDAAAIEDLLTEGYDEHPELFRKLVTDRNQRWLPQIEELLHGDRDAMVIVGSLHLVGEHGLVELLREQGFRVEQQ